MAIVLLTEGIMEWLVYKVLLYTELFTGPDQFLIQLVLNSILPDLYFMLYCPLTWIRCSVRNSWAGWGSNTQRAHFYFVRKPDPREELTRTGHFVNVGQFLYVRKKTQNSETFLEKQMRFQLDHYVYLVRQPMIEHGNKVRVEQRKLFLSKSKDLESTQLPKVEWENIDIWEGQDHVDTEIDNSVIGKYDPTLMPQDESHENETPIHMAVY